MGKNESLAFTRDVDLDILAEENRFGDRFM